MKRLIKKANVITFYHGTGTDTLKMIFNDQCLKNMNTSSQSGIYLSDDWHTAYEYADRWLDPNDGQTQAILTFDFDLKKEINNLSVDEQTLKDYIDNSKSSSDFDKLMETGYRNGLIDIPDEDIKENEDGSLTFENSLSCYKINPEFFSQINILDIYNFGLSQFNIVYKGDLPLSKCKAIYVYAGNKYKLKNWNIDALDNLLATGNENESPDDG